MNAAKRAQIYSRLAEANPDPRTELAYGSEFELLIAVALSTTGCDLFSSINDELKAGEREASQIYSQLLGVFQIEQFFPCERQCEIRFFF